MNMQSHKRVLVYKFHVRPVGSARASTRRRSFFHHLILAIATAAAAGTVLPFASAAAPVISLVTATPDATAMSAAAAQGAPAIGNGAGRGASSEVIPSGGTALVSGIVVDGVTGQPVAEAVVTVAGRGAGAARGVGPGGRGGEPAANLQLLTGADGRFVVHDLPAVVLTISASASGYAAGAFGQVRPAGLSMPVEVADGAVINNIRIPVWKFASISGTVTDEAGEPAVDTVVRVLRRTFGVMSSSARYAPVATTRTDDRGTYRVGSLAPGDYIVQFPQTLSTVPTGVAESIVTGVLDGAGTSALLDLSSAGIVVNNEGRRVGDLSVSTGSTTQAVSGGGRTTAYETLYAPDANTLSQAGVFGLSAGVERQGVNIQLRLVPTARVSGRVVLPSGQSGLQAVRLVRAPATGEDVAPDNSDVATAVARGDGSFTFIGVPHGDCVALVERRPRAALPPELASNPLMQQALGPGAMTAAAGMWGRAPVSVRGDVDNVSIDINTGYTISGHVTVEDGQPLTPEELATVSITLTPLNGGSTSGGRVRRDGTFTLSPTAPGRYLITGVAGGRPGYSLRRAMDEGRDISQDVIDLGGNRTDVNVIVGTLPQVKGTVRQMPSAPFIPTRVFLFPADVRGWAAAGMSRRRMQMTDVVTSAGSFTLGAPGAGEYFLAALSDVEDGYQRDPLAFYQALAAVATRIAVTMSEQRTVEINVASLGASR